MQQIRVKIKKISTNTVRYVNYDLDVDMLFSIQNKLNVPQGDYMIIDYKVE